MPLALTFLAFERQFDFLHFKNEKESHLLTILLDYQPHSFITQTIVPEPNNEMPSSGDLELTVYSPQSELANPGRLCRDIARDVWRYRELIWMLFMRDLRAQYRQTFLGYLWIIAPVLSTMLVWVFLKSSNAIKVAETPIPYAAYVMLGSFAWAAFTQSVNQPLLSFNAGKAVFTKLRVPAEAFILAGFCKVAFDQCVRLLVLFPVLFCLGVYPIATGWLFPVGVACTMMLGMAVGFLLLPLGSLYTDVSRAVTIALGFAMYVTPVVYPPPTGDDFVARLIHANPLTGFVVVTRDWLTLGHNAEYFPSLMMWTLFSVALLGISLMMFRITLPRLIERMGM